MEESKYLRGALDALPQAMLWVNQHGSITFANRSGCYLTGYAVDELLNLDIFRLNISPDGTGWSNCWKDLKTGTTRQFNASLRCRNGKTLEADMILSALVDDIQTIASLIIVPSFHSDVIREGANSSLVELCHQASNEGLWDWHIDSGRIVLVNYWQDGSSQQIETSWAHLIHRDDFDHFSSLLKVHLLNESGIFEEECRIKARTGGWVWHLFRGRVVGKNSAGESVRMVGTFVDATRRKQMEDDLELYRDQLENLISRRTASLQSSNEALKQEIDKSNRVEEELRQAKADLEATNLNLEMAMKHAKEKAAEAELASVAKNEFLAAMSHEIRTPLNGVIGMIELLSETPLNQQQREYLEPVKTESETLLTIINDILDYSRIESGRMELDMASFQLPNEIANIRRLIQPLAKAKGLGLEVKIDPELVRPIISDQVRIRQVLVNLLNNAIKFTRDGHVELHVDCLSNTDTSVNLLMSVIDTGIGIPESQLKSVFSAFKQVDGRLTRGHGGTGLGLTICQRIVTLLGGQIWVESESGRGSAFFVRMKMDYGKLEEAPAVGDSLPITIHDLSPERTPGKPWATILLAEDYPVSQRLLGTHLERAGFEVLYAHNGAEAVEIFNKRRMDLVVLDVQMPIMDGLTAARLIREQEAATSRSPVPIIALTAAVFENEKIRCYQAGMNDFVSKPIRKADFLTVVARWLSPGGISDKESSLARTCKSEKAFDFDLVIEEFEGDRVLVLSVLAQFEENLENHLAEMEHALSKGIFSHVESVAHAVKGGASNLMAHSLAGEAERLLMLAHMNNADACSSQLKRLRSEVNRFIHECHLIRS